MSVHSLSGLKMDFLDPKKRGSGRKRFAHAYSPTTPPKRGSVASPTVMADIGEFVAHATRKPALISSRSALRRYERENDVKQCGHDLGDIVSEDKAKWDKIRKNATTEAGWHDPEF